LAFGRAAKEASDFTSKVFMISARFLEMKMLTAFSKFAKTVKRDEPAVRHEVQRYIMDQCDKVAGKTLGTKISALKRWFKANELSVFWDLLEKPRRAR
jgi:hypothetical protein